MFDQMIERQAEHKSEFVDGEAVATLGESHEEARDRLAPAVLADLPGDGRGLADLAGCGVHDQCAVVGDALWKTDAWTTHKSKKNAVPFLERVGEKDVFDRSAEDDLLASVHRFKVTIRVALMPPA